MEAYTWRGSVKGVTIYLKLLRRQQYECNHCNVYLFSLVKSKNRLFVLHHKNRNHDDDRLINLELLCPSCHSIEHKKETLPAMRKRAPKHHTVQTKLKISQKLKKLYKENPALRLQIANANKGNHHTEKTKANLSKKHKKLVLKRKRNKKGQFLKRRKNEYATPI